MSKYFQIKNDKGTILVDDEYKMVSRKRRVKIPTPKINTAYGFALTDNEYFAVIEFDRGSNSEFDIMITPPVVTGGVKFIYVAFKNIKGSAPSVYVDIYALGGNKHSHGNGLEVYASNGRLVYSSLELFSFTKRGEEQGRCCNDTKFINKMLQNGVSYAQAYDVREKRTEYHFPTYEFGEQKEGYWEDIYYWTHNEFTEKYSVDTNISHYVSSCSHTAGSYNANAGNNLGIYVQNSCIFPDIKGSVNQVYSQRFHVVQNSKTVKLTTPKEMTYFNISNISGGVKGALSKSTSYSVETVVTHNCKENVWRDEKMGVGSIKWMSRNSTLSYNYGFISTQYHGFILDIPI